MKSKLFVLLILLMISISCSRTDSPMQEACRHIPFYFLPPPNHYMPIIDVEIDGVKYPCGLDLGANVGDITLRKEVLQKIASKEETGISSRFDLHGNLYHTKKYLIESIKLNELEIKNVIASEESVELLKNTLLFSSEAEQELEESLAIVGRIGINIFKQYVCLLDFHNSSIFLSNTVDRTVSKQWKEASLDITSGLAFMSFTTDLGIRTFVLDTGSEACLFQESFIDKAALLPKNTVKQSSSGRWLFRTLSMKIGNVDFGEQRFVLFEFEQPSKTIDGILGIDFFQKHPMCLDFPNRRAYLQPPRKPFWYIPLPFESFSTDTQAKEKTKP